MPSRIPPLSLPRVRLVGTLFVTSVAALTGPLWQGCANVQTDGGSGKSTGGSSGKATGGSTPGQNGSGGKNPSGDNTGGRGASSETGGTPFDGGIIARDADATCGLTKFMVERMPADILLLLDRSGSMRERPSGSTATTTKWELVVPALSGVITATDAGIAWAYKSFPEGTGTACASGSVSPAIDVEMAPANAAKVNDAIMATTPDGNGTPTGDAIKAAATYLMGLNDGARHSILLATDGEPSCPTGSSAAATYAIQAVTDAATAGISTFVVGIATSNKSSTATLNQLADAGGSPVKSTDPAAPHYYLASTSDDLIKSLQTITGKVASCDFTFKMPPPVPDNIAVDVEGVRLPKSDTDGWSYMDSGFHGIRINGAACEKLQKAAVGAVQITFGCPDVVIP